MKFLVDVNASGILAAWLKDQGHDVAEVTARDRRMKDIDILRWAVDEQRVIVTTDQDFEERIWREQRPHYGVLRMENLPRQQRLTLLIDVMNHHMKDLEDRAIVIAQTRRIRIRKSP